jgi:Ion channel
MPKSLGIHKDWNKAYKICGPIILVLAILSLVFKLSWLAEFVLVPINLYLIVLLIISAYLSDLSEKNVAANKPTIEKYYELIPTRRMGMFLFSLFLISVVLCFAALFLDMGEYFKQPITGWKDAIYVSFGTITTANFGDFVPVKYCAKFWTSLETLNSIILFFGAFALLVSNLATFKKPI